VNLRDKSRFPRACEVAYLDTAAEGLPPAGCAEALAAYYRDKADGTPGRRRLHQVEHDTHCAAARLLGTTPENVAFLANASDGINLLANSLDWREGDEALVTDLEFPSNVLPWLRLKDRGVRLRVLPSTGGELTLEQFQQAVGPSTRVLSVSHVSYKNGGRIPFLNELGRLAHAAGAVFAVDATQALGRLPVPLGNVDYLVASSYKWLLGTHGLGVTYLSPELRDRLAPATAGWYSVQSIFTPDRFERFEYKAGAARLAAGMPNFPALYALRYSLDYLLQTDMAALETALTPLVGQLREGVAAMGFRLLTPPGAAYASGIVAFEHPQAEAIGTALEEAGVIVWAGDGRVRASVHLYNDAADVERLLAALRSLPVPETARV
jgi:selenocysteine lyase/cysteine desulfurase